MRRVYQVASLVFIAIGIYTVWEAQNLVLYSEMGPGAGFFPFWMGLLFIGLSVLWLGQVSTQPQEPMESDFVPNRAGMARIAAILAALAVFTMVVTTLGFQVMMFAFLMFLLMVLGRQNLILTLFIAVVGSVGVFYVFNNYLDVHLPESSIEFLSNLGL